MGTQGKHISRRDELLQALITPPFSRIDEAAERVGLARKTAYNYHSDPEFRRAVREGRRAFMGEQMESARDTMREALPDATIEYLRLALEAESEQVRLAALKDLYDRVLGKAPDQLRLAGADGGPIRSEHRVTLESYAAYFKRLADDDAGRLGDAVQSVEGHGDSEPVDSSRSNGKAGALPDGILP